jgi:hypothetical protein
MTGDDDYRALGHRSKAQQVGAYIVMSSAELGLLLLRASGRVPPTSSAGTPVAQPEHP